MRPQNTVLITDDDEDIRLTLRAYLEDCDYRVVEAQDGRDGLTVIAREKPDVVVTDLRMPDMDGFHFIDCLKTESPGTPVIIITGTGDPSLAQEACRAGAAACLFKPFPNMAELADAIRDALAQSRHTS